MMDRHACIPAPLTPDQAVKWDHFAEAEGAESCRLGPRMARAAVALHGFAGPAGCFPSIKTIARASRTSIGTVLACAAERNRKVA